MCSEWARVVRWGLNLHFGVVTDTIPESISVSCPPVPLTNSPPSNDTAQAGHESVKPSYAPLAHILSLS
ncbi:unnamed protein product [Zymoseptoria tritici ST99CH_3D7]|uniref:Uncharacterized protein n=1 Tax=Zymoseptoria tritici (strain ST99CH_3D7) TaxID=1276538 RepID=A0A1X7S8H2_ZYMT9|nr:unnamed protein product [Zymoseptoria tritici ST99CH_3D7]